MNILKQLYKLPKACIYVIKNDKKKCIYISYSKNFITSLSRNIKEMQEGIHTCKFLNGGLGKWELTIIETLTYHHTILEISCSINSIIETYKALGYEIKTHKNVMKVRFRVDIGEDYRVYCKLITKGYNEYIVGVFLNMKDAEDLITQYRNMKVITPIYANNALTKEYFESL